MANDQRFIDFMTLPSDETLETYVREQKIIPPKQDLQERWRALRGNPTPPTVRRTYDHRTLINHIQEEIHPFFAELSPGPFPESVQPYLLGLAGRYAASGLGHCEYMHNPQGVRNYARLVAIMSSPAVLGERVPEGQDPVLIKMLLARQGKGPALKDMPTSTPWEFCLWQEEQEPRRGNYVLRAGMGLPQVEGLRRLVEDARLWEGDTRSVDPEAQSGPQMDREFGRIFYTSVASALRGLSGEYFRETFPVRVALLEKNAAHGKHHEVWCNAQLEPEDVDRYMAETGQERITVTLTQDPRSRNHTFADLYLPALRKDEAIVYHPHWC
jgi:hypothetical protein